MHNELEIALAAARAGGEILVARLGNQGPIRFKGVSDLVTDADEASEACVVEQLLRAFPTDRILAEEGTAAETRSASSGRLWIIDPLDGTTNFAHGYPIFAVSIALEIDGVVQVGVVHAPVLHETFTAIRGEGARLNDNPIRVSGTRELGASLVCMGIPYRPEERPRSVRDFEKLVFLAQAVRRDGSAALDLCFTAAGRFDGYWERTLNPWDIAAGALIVEEAGGQLSLYDGSQLDIRAGDIVATNGLIHQELVSALKSRT